jgi:pimeloyl-ACP methyl ester carboxylesterase
MASIIYLHGFASSPNSKKAMIFRDRFAAAGIEIEVPELAVEGFHNLTISGQLRVIESSAAGRGVSLIGSSLGGYLAALYAARHPEVDRLVLLAPAFGFARRWEEELGEEALRQWQQTGSRQVMNYAAGGMTSLGWQFLEDARKYEDEPAITQPCLIYHGMEDDVVPVGASRSFARTRTCSELREVVSNHELLNVIDEVWQGSKEFLLGA